MVAQVGVIVVVPANEATWDDLQRVLGERGQASRCQCQRYKLQPGESFASFPAAERADRLRQLCASCWVGMALMAGCEHYVCMVGVEDVSLRLLAATLLTVPTAFETRP